MTCRRRTVESAVLLSNEVGSMRDFRLLWCSGDLRSSGLLRRWVSWLPMFQESLPYASLRVKILTFKDGIDTLSQNVTNIENGIDTLS